ncbi:MAG: ADP-ribosylglycohydrolase family protein [Deltaproteobacteria bacterium]|jgi:ADP-ribosylglycohydrolase|nr:ADP-ribosylglycohydrolase family protein [Deltaproteobacteria bacterium]
MLGAIAGDIIGSVFENNPIKSTAFPLFSKYSHFTDDSVLTVAIAHSVLKQHDYVSSLKNFARKYPNAGYGLSFYRWIQSSATQPYNIWGNGSAIRVIPVGFAFENEETVIREAQKSAAVTHNHPEGIKGAQATALAICLARHGAGKTQIRQAITERFGYDLKRTLDEIRPTYHFDVSCQKSVPESLLAFFESKDYEDAVRKAISLGGDTDTMACIAGGIAQAFYRKIPATIVAEVRLRLPKEFLEIIDEFNERFGIEY